MGIGFSISIISTAYLSGALCRQLLLRSVEAYPLELHAVMKIFRIYQRVSTDQQDLSRQLQLEDQARSAGYHLAGIYREKASGTTAERPELKRMISDLQPG